VISDAISAGADGYIEKPVDFEKFLSRIRAILPETESEKTPREATLQ
jgi:DNA-binding response OmpR family regulator